MNTVLTLILGISLSATCGFRVFVPFLAVGVFGRTYGWHLGSGLEWTMTGPALLILSIATMVEILGYLIPWVDHALDVISVPSASIAGTLMTHGWIVENVDPAMGWILSAVAGGTAAGGTSTVMAFARGGMTAATGGIANPIFNIIETVFAILMAILSLIAPVLAFLAITLGAFGLYRFAKKLCRRFKPVVLEEVIILEPLK